MTQVTLRQLHHLKVAIPAIDPSWIVPTWPTGGGWSHQNGPMIKWGGLESRDQVIRI